MLNVHAQVFELFDEELDLVLLRVTAHVSKLFIFVPSNDLIDSPGDSVCDGDLSFIC